MPTVGCYSNLLFTQSLLVSNSVGRYDNEESEVGGSSPEENPGLGWRFGLSKFDRTNTRWIVLTFDNLLRQFRRRNLTGKENEP